MGRKSSTLNNKRGRFVGDVIELERERAKKGFKQEKEIRGN